MRSWANTLSLDKAAAIASSSRDTDMQQPSKISSGNKAAVGRMGGVGKNIAKTLPTAPALMSTGFEGNQRDFKEQLFRARKKLPGRGRRWQKRRSPRSAGRILQARTEHAR